MKHPAGRDAKNRIGYGVRVFLYRLLFSLGFPALLLRIVADALRLRSLTDLRQRLGLGHDPAPDPAVQAQRIWLHAASVGEITSVRPLIDRLLGADPALWILVTVNTATARSLVTGWAHPRIVPTLAPLDHRLVLARFLRRTAPVALVTVESEIWPNRLAACRARRIPVLMVGARMSARSARIWGRVPALARAALGAVTYLSAQDEASARHFGQLGLPADRIGPVIVLKALLPALADMPEIPLPYPRGFTLLAASTHDGEEAVILDAFVAARAAQPALRLILAPRHPARRDQIEALIVARGLGFAARSRNQPPDPAIPVYLADTLGEMGSWYAAAAITFVGGSITDRGGHTPFEPAAAGSAILHGLHLANFAPAYAALDAAGAAQSVTDAATLAAATLALTDPALQRARAAAARAALAAFSPPDALAPFLSAMAEATGLPLAPAASQGPGGAAPDPRAGRPA